MVTVHYSHTNQAYMVLFGKGRASDKTIVDFDGQRLFSNKSELVETLGRKGLKLKGSQVVKN